MKKGLGIGIVMILTLIIAIIVGLFLLAAIRYFNASMGKVGVLVALGGGAVVLLIILYVIELSNRFKQH